MKKAVTLFFTIFAVLFLALPVSSQTILDFNDPTISDFQTYPGYYKEDGYIFRSEALYGHFKRVAPGGYAMYPNKDGLMPGYDSAFLAFTYATQPILERIDRTPFDLHYVNIGSWFYNFQNEKMRITGHRGSDTIYDENLTLNVNRFTHYDLDWKNVDYVRIWDDALMDNIKLAVAPEPISSILFITGGVVLGLRRLRKK